MTLRLAALGLCFALLLGAGGGTLCAQQQRVRAYVEPATIDDSTRIQLVIEIQDLGRGQVEPPPLPRKLPNLRVIGGPSRNSQFSWIQGRALSTYSLIYTLLPDGPGPAEIPSIVVKVDGRPYRTETIRFEVAKSQDRPPRTPAAPRTQPTQAVDNADVFLRAELGTDSIWVGQPVTLTFKLFTAVPAGDGRWLGRPDFGNFWVENIDVSSGHEQYRTQSGGRSYNVFPLERKVLIPPTPGEFTIEPRVLELQVTVASGGDVFQRMFGRTQTIVRKSNPLELSVRELPAGAPEDFGGAIGSYRIRAALDRNDAAVDDAVALRVTVDGEGSLRSVAPPTVQAPADLRLFEPRVTDSFDLAGGKLRSKKSWEWIIVPLAPGELRLPEIGFTFFNPATESYETAQTESILLAVGKSERPDDRPSARGGIQAQRRDLAFVKLLRGRLEQDYPRAHERTLFLTLLLLPLLWMPLVVVIGRRRARLQRDQGLARSRRARARARKRLRSARKNLDQTDSAAFHEEVARALVEYIADRFNRSATGLTYDVADELLASRAVDAELRREFRGCLETCDFARFVPAAGETERREKTLRQADELVERLERAC